MASIKNLVLYYVLLLLFESFAVAEKLQFNRDIRPILSENCFHCHGPDSTTREAKLRLDTRSGALKNDVIIPGNPEDSELIYRITTKDKDEVMPPPEHHIELSKTHIKTLKQWIREGAEYQKHWSFEKPIVSTTGNISEVIDGEISRKLIQKKLKPSATADRQTLIRRLSLDLRGLPPSIAEIDQFVKDASPQAYEKLVDALLASPQTAERLALDWLDVARFSDTNGYSIDDHREMWGWRDWVIYSFLNNKAYDVFLTEQLAGDLIPNATPEQVMATGFLRNGMNTHEGGTIEEEYRVAYIADKIDTVSSTFMGLTMKCAQCHNHKYDPISQEDYYRFYAFFNSATERGKGATNGNTAPFIEITSPLHSISDSHRALKKRAERMHELRNNLKFADPKELESWKAELSQKSARDGGNSTMSDFAEHNDDAEWIWSAKEATSKHILMRTLISTSIEIESAQVVFSGVNETTLYVNGKKAAKGSNWMEPTGVNITSFMKQGRNIIGVDVRNTEGPAGFIAWLKLELKGGKTQYFFSGPEWQWKLPKGKNISSQLARNDQWKSAVSMAKHGGKPWGKLKLPKQENQALQLAKMLENDPKKLTQEEHTILNQAYLKRLSPLRKRFYKSLGIELGVIEKQIKNAGKTTVMVMDSPGKRKTHILIRGEYNNPGVEVSAGVPELFSPLPKDQPADRLALARWLTSPSHPLTARVAVNRYWQLIFGKGLVRTAEDFGSQGEWPSHPQLLDSLAVKFREGGWDVRALLKGMVMSDTYRQESAISSELLELDPQNRFLARAPRARLSAELLRDNALAISGRLNLQIGGPSVYPEQPDGLWRQISHFGYGAFTAQAYYADAGLDTRRRSMYSFWKRTSPPPSLAIFDAPTRETCTVRRLQTNTPLQALVLLNDPQYIKASGGLARRMIEDGGTKIEDRIRYAFRLATARLPRPSELEILTAAYGREKRRFISDPAAAKAFIQEAGIVAKQEPELASLIVIASTILNLNETITKQ